MTTGAGREVDIIGVPLDLGAGRRGIGPIIEEVLSAFAGTAGGIHLSLDLDGLDPEVAPGVGTPVRDGLSYREAHLLCETIAASGLL